MFFVFFYFKHYATLYAKRIVCKVALENKLSILTTESLSTMANMHDPLSSGRGCMIYEISSFIKELTNGDKCDICLASLSLHKTCHLLLCGNNTLYI